MSLTPEQITRITARISKQVETALMRGSVEQHYSTGSLAELLQVTERTIHTYLDQYDSTSGREGLGPVVKLSHKAMRIPASSVRRWLESRTIDAARLTGSTGEERAA